MRWRYFPKSQKITNELSDLVAVFKKQSSEISSVSHELESNDVLAVIKDSLVAAGYKTELSKKKKNTIKMPVTYGENGYVDLSFEVDAYLESSGIVVEVEAGRAVANYQFLKDLFEACCMADAEYLCIAVREIYRTSKDYQKVCKFFEALYASERFSIPLKGILVIGY